MNGAHLIPGERITHPEFGAGVVLDAPSDGYLRAFFSIGDDEDMQRVWAREHGLASNTSLGDILKAQIEHHRADVFYNLDTAGWGYDLIKGLPGCVNDRSQSLTICWA